MSQKNLCTTLMVSLKICVFVVILLSERCSCDDKYYESCVPRKCEHGPNISFPFYIAGQQESYCGYPGFQLSCNNQGYTILHLYDNDYVVEQIFYESSSVRVFNSVFEGFRNGCFPQIENLSLVGSPFRFADVSYVHYLSDCNTTLSGDLEKYKIGCNGESGEGGYGESGLVLSDKDENLESAKEECKREVLAPVEVYQDDGNGVVGEYFELMKNGFSMSWIASDCSECQGSGGKCGFNSSNLHFSCFCPDRPHSASCKPSKSKNLGLILGTVGAACILILCLVTYIIWHRKKRIRGGSPILLSRNLSSDPSSKGDLEEGSVYHGVPVYSYKDLEKATDYFASDNELGDGGFGIVYYGKLRDGREVAVKRLYEHNYKRMEQFMNEIKILTNLRHPNLVSLYGCTSRRSRELLLVYEYIANGTVADHIHGDRAAEKLLTWSIRINIAVETANAMAYLHKSTIIHRDVKTNNILLDPSFRVKLADFGLSRLFPNDVTHVSTAPQGTPGYVDPEYHECYQLTEKSDVYSFGVVLIELISSMPAVDISRHRHDINLANLAISRIQRNALDELIDPWLGYHSDPEVRRMTTSVAELAFRCLQLERDMRPTMDEVFEALEVIRDGKENSEAYKSGVNKGEKVKSSSECDEAVLLKNMNLPNSPISVTQVCFSGSSTASVGG